MQEEAESEGPLTMIDFWPERHANLQNLQAQLDSEEVQNISRILTAAGSKYVPAFHR